MNNNFVAVIAGLICLGMYFMFCFGISAFFLAALKQFTQINLFIYYNDLPISVFVLTFVLIILSSTIITKSILKDNNEKTI